MKPLSHGDILQAFAAHERPDTALPPEPAWDELDFLAWIHRSGHLGYVVFQGWDDTRGLVLERSVVRTSGLRRFMCDLCCTIHGQGGIASFTRWNRARTQARTQSLCADLACSLYVRGLQTNGCAQLPETISREKRIERLFSNFNRFVERMKFDD